MATKPDPTPDPTPPQQVGAAPIVQPENPPPGVTDGTPDGTTVDGSLSYIDAIRENYSQFRATARIPWGNAIAFNPGDAVPADYPTLEQLLADGAVEAVPAGTP